MTKRVSLGQYFFNDGKPLECDETSVYQFDRSRKFYIFDICPVAAPRMTQSDRWRVNPNHPDINKRQREVVTKYFAYKDMLRLQANLMKFEMGSVLEVLFLMPMPQSWSQKKRDAMNGLPCKVKPDADNLMKAIKDTFCENDSHIWRETSEKRWAHKGSVIIYV